MTTPVATPPGPKLSALELIVATIAQRWSLALGPGHRVVPQPVVTLRAKHGMRMIARHR